MIGGQSALEIGAFASIVAIVIGTLYGAISGLVGGFVDGVLMRFVDVLLSIPFLLIVAGTGDQVQRHGARASAWCSASSHG